MSHKCDICEKEYTKGHKARHEKSKKHMDAVKDLEYKPLE